MTALFATTSSLATTSWPLSYRKNKDSKFEYESGISAEEKSSLKMSRSFYVDSLLLNRSVSNTTERCYAKVLASTQQLGEKRSDCYSHHHDAFDSCRLCNQDYIPTTSAPRLPLLPPSSIYNTTQIAIPISYSSSVSHYHHSTGSISPHRHILDNKRISGYRNHRTIIPLGTKSHVTRQGTPSPPSSHLQYKKSMDGRSLSPNLPYGKRIYLVYLLIILCMRQINI